MRLERLRDPQPREALAWCVRCERAMAVTAAYRDADRPSSLALFCPSCKEELDDA
jgi:hypothetical protein